MSGKLSKRLTKLYHTTVDSLRVGISPLGRFGAISASKFRNLILAKDEG
jgi:hypothetical protein